jgi:hypothetical protein
MGEHGGLVRVQERRRGRERLGEEREKPRFAVEPRGAAGVGVATRRRRTGIVIEARTASCRRSSDRMTLSPVFKSVATR